MSTGEITRAQFPSPDVVARAIPPGKRLYVEAHVALTDMAANWTIDIDEQRLLVGPILARLHRIHNEGPSEPPLSDDLGEVLHQALVAVSDRQLYCREDVHNVKVIVAAIAMHGAVATPVAALGEVGAV